MSRFNLTRILVFSIVFAGAIFGERRFNSREWMARISIYLPEDRSAEVLYISLTPQILRASLAELADLRIVDADGREVPYVIQELRGSEIAKSVYAEPVKTEKSNDRLRTTKIEGPSPGLINRALLICSGFFTSTAVLEVSLDGQHWKEVFRDTIYRTPLANPNRTPVEKLTIDFPETEAAFLRVRLENFSPWSFSEAEESFGFYGVHPAYVEKTMTSYVAVEQAVEPVEGKDDGTISWDIALPERIIADHLQVSIAEAEFNAKYRLYRLWRLPNGSWRTGRLLASGEMVRKNHLPENPLYIPLPSISLPGRIRFTLEPANGVKPGLTYLSVRAVEKRVLFKATGPGPYALYIGNRSAAAPRYSPAETTELLRRRSIPVATIGQLSWNPEYQPAPLVPPLSRLFTFSLGVALAGFILGLYLFMKIRDARRARLAEGRFSRPRP